MIQDIMTGDVAKKIVKEQDSLLTDKDKEITFKDSVTTFYKNKYKICEDDISRLNQTDSLNRDSIKNLEKTIKKERFKTYVYKFTTYTALLITTIVLIVK